MSMSPTKFSEVVKANAYPVLMEGYESETPVYPLVCRMVPESEMVSPFGHKTTTVTGMGLPVEREDGENIAETSFGEGYTVYMKRRLLAQRIPYPERLVNSLDDKGLGAMVMRDLRFWGVGFVIQKETLAANIFNKGPLTAGHAPTFNQSYAGETDPYPLVSYDNQPFFDTAHAAKVTGTTYSNHNASNALTATTYDTSYTQMVHTNAFDERDRKIAIRPDLLVVPPQLRSTALRITRSELLPGGAQNDINPNRNLTNTLVWRYLTDTDGWFMGQGNRGVMCFDSGAPVLRTWFDEEKKQYWVSAECEFGVAPENWRFWLCNNVAAS